MVEAWRLSPEQTRARARALGGFHIFITGPGGVGKSAIVALIRGDAIARGRVVATTATTGIASVPICGTTLHTFLGAGLAAEPVLRIINNILTGKSMQAADTRARLRAVDMLIVDEVSMLSAELLEKLTAVLRVVRAPTREQRRAMTAEMKETSRLWHKAVAPPFPKFNASAEALRSWSGGVQFVFVGDFLQMPPVVREDVPYPRPSGARGGARGEEEGVTFAFECATWRALFPAKDSDVSGTGTGSVCELVENFRQKNAEFVALLGAVRRGQISQYELDEINRRVIGQGASAVRAERAGVVRLCPTNGEADRINRTKLAALKSDAETYIAEDTGASESARNLLAKNCLAPEALVLKVGAAVMALKNGSGGNDAIKNGSVGVVMRFKRCKTTNEDGSEGPVVARPVVEFSASTNSSGAALTVTMRPAEFKIEDRGRVLACREQYPLRLAWAITGHKSQGMTLALVRANFTYIFETGQVYVMLSRCKTLDGLYLDTPVTKKAVRAHPKAVAYYKDLENTRMNHAARIARVHAGEDKPSPTFKRSVVTTPTAVVTEPAISPMQHAKNTAADRGW